MPVFRPRRRPPKKKRRPLSQPAKQKIARRFRRAVNMSAGAIDDWLRQPESRAVGVRRPGARESIGRQSGRQIARILRRGPRTEADYQHMQKVAGYVARHTAQRPAGNVRDTRWRYSLKNWGHEPLR